MKNLLPTMGIATTLALLSQSTRAAIVGVEVPSRDGYRSCALDLIQNPSSQISVTAPPYPLDTSYASGIGYILHTGATANNALNSWDYSAPNIPGNATVIYHFDRPTTVDQLEVYQTVNGITRVEGFVGNDLGSLLSIGNVFGPSGDLTGAQVLPGGLQLFDFPTSAVGTYFQFTVTKTSNPAGWAILGAFPLTADGARIEPATEPYVVPEPGTYGLIASLGLAAFGFFRRMRA